MTLLALLIATLLPFGGMVPPTSQGGAPEATAFNPGHAPFAVEFGDAPIPYHIMAMSVMPATETHISVPDSGIVNAYVLDASDGTVRPDGNHAWHWTAPSAPGLYPITVRDMATRATVTINAFVLTPYDHRDQSLNGYTIGRYRTRPLRGDPAYKPPEGFIEVTPDTRQAQVSPHFTLEQFLSKQEATSPEYVLIRPALLWKLEATLEAVNTRGIRANTFHVMSGFRTPYYNRAIGNRTPYSRHLYGGAADIFIDMNGDGQMDDLTGDGRATRADARWLADIIDHLTRDPNYEHLKGGLSAYGPAAHRGPFVHLDVRGKRARW